MAAPATLRQPPSPAFALTAEGTTLAEVLEEHLSAMPPWKRMIDLAGAAIGLALLLPLFAVIAVAIMLETPGGPIFRQTRVGRGGRLFMCWKFRSMRKDAEQMKASLLALNEANGHIFKLRDDPRRTRVGKFLRKTSLDELPQLWNVLKGEMSLVGPRPPLPAEVARYSERELLRLAVEPGITGLWQVTLRGRHDFADMVALDIEYARRRSLPLDLRIYAQTVVTVLRGSGSV